MIDPRTRDCTLFLGAEGCSEMEGQPWLREPTDEEIAELKTERTSGRDPIEAEADWNGLFMDRTNRPYHVMTVTREAPLKIWLRASSHLRMVRLEE